MLNLFWGIILTKWYVNIATANAPSASVKVLY